MARRVIRITGVDKVLAKLEKADVGVKQVAEDVTAESALMMFNKALANIGSSNYAYSLGQVAGGMHFNELNPLTWEVFNSSEHAPFIEWGTGAQVDVPAEWQSMAQGFIKSGSGSFADMLDNLRNWLSGVGGDPNNAYIVAIGILNRGLRARPFFYPSFVEAKKFYQDEMAKQIKTLLK